MYLKVGKSLRCCPPSKPSSNPYTDICFENANSNACIGASPASTKTFQIGTEVPLSVGFTGSPSSNLNNYFFCFTGSGSNVCDGYSNLFDIGSTSPGVTAVASFAATPTVPITVATTASSLNLIQTASVTISSSLVSTSLSTTDTSGSASQSSTGMPTMSWVTVSQTPTTTTTITPTPTSADSAVNASPSSSHQSGLAVGAIVGIALGALVLLIALLLLALFCLRRAHKNKNKQTHPPPEQVLLTRGMHADSFSQNVTPTEKISMTTASEALPLAQPADILSNDQSLPIQGNTTPPYTSPPSIPYSGVAAAVPTPASAPRRKPTTATMTSTVSRGLSASSNGSRSIAMSPRSDFEEYHDMPSIPVYGDARHIPQIFEGRPVPERRHSPQIFEGRVPESFLSEEGLSPEEMARLEEEERRIDLAIAEAEERAESRAQSRTR
jgi:hypothetical protein